MAFYRVQIFTKALLFRTDISSSQHNAKNVGKKGMLSFC
jgi:hypothetical protein